jgi:putative transposase
MISDESTGMLERHGWDGSYDDNLFIERLSRTVRHEEVCLKACQDGPEAEAALADYFHFYNNERPQQALGYR